MESKPEESQDGGAEGYSAEELKAAEDAISSAGAFNYNKLMRLYQSIISGFENNKVPIADYAEMLMEWTRFFKYLGKAMGLAFSGKNQFSIFNSYRFCFNVFRYYI